LASSQPIALPGRLPPISSALVGSTALDDPDLEHVERELLMAARETHDWNQTRAAAYLDITPAPWSHQRPARHAANVRIDT
jgi:hypothetical protein